MHILGHINLVLSYKHLEYTIVTLISKKSYKHLGIIHYLPE